MTLKVLKRKNRPDEIFKSLHGQKQEFSINRQILCSVRDKYKSAPREFFDIMENNLISLNFFVNFAVFLDSVASLELRANVSLPNQGIIGVNNDK